MVRTEKFAIIGGEIHRLVVIKPNDEWFHYAWKIKEHKNQYWVPVADEKSDRLNGEWKWVNHRNQKVVSIRKNKLWGNGHWE